MIERMQDAVSSTLDSSTEAVIVTLVVVVTHVALWSGEFDVCVDFYFFSWSTTFVLNVVDGIGAATVILLSDVDLISEVSIVVLTTIVFDVCVISCTSTIDFDVDFGVSVFSWTSIPMRKLVLLKLFVWAGLLFSVEFYSWVTAVTISIPFFVNSNVLSVSASVVSDVDIDFFLGVSSIFPSDARGATLVLDFPFYLGGGRFFGSSVTPVRRREDTDRNGDAGVKVQIARLEGVLTLFSLSAVESQD